MFDFVVIIGIAVSFSSSIVVHVSIKQKTENWMNKYFAHVIVRRIYNRTFDVKNVPYRSFFLYSFDYYWFLKQAAEISIFMKSFYIYIHYTLYDFELWLHRTIVDVLWYQREVGTASEKLWYHKS